MVNDGDGRLMVNDGGGSLLQVKFVLCCCYAFCFALLMVNAFWGIESNFVGLNINGLNLCRTYAWCISYGLCMITTPDFYHQFHTNNFGIKHKFLNTLLMIDFEYSS